MAKQQDQGSNRQPQQGKGEKGPQMSQDKGGKGPVPKPKIGNGEGGKLGGAM